MKCVKPHCAPLRVGLIVEPGGEIVQCLTEVPDTTVSLKHRSFDHELKRFDEKQTMFDWKHTIIGRQQGIIGRQQQIIRR